MFLENSSRGQFYGSFKKDFGLENYLVRLNEKTRIWMTKQKGVKFTNSNRNWAVV